jgi:hypothetical protein
MTTTMRLCCGKTYEYRKKSSWVGVMHSSSGSSVETFRVKLLKIKGNRVNIEMPPCETYPNGHDTWIDRNELKEIES